MTKQFNIELDFNGMVLFDPHRLVAFRQEQQISTPKLFQYFIDHEEIGKKAIDQGVIIPIYPIDADNYAIEASLDPETSSNNQQVVFSHDRYGIESVSGIIVFSDIYAIMDWDDEDFFLNYIERFSQKSVHNDYFETGTGKFRVQIQGCKMQTGTGGYRFVFRRTDSLPLISNDAAVDDMEFNISAYY